MAKIPNLPMTDTLLHAKVSDRSEILIFPITRYDNVVGAPKVVTASTIRGGSPFQLLRTDDVELPVSQIRYLCGNIL